MVGGKHRVHVKFECKKVYPCENSRAVLISPRNSGTVIDSEKSLINANWKSTMGFWTTHQPKSCVISNFPKMRLIKRSLSFFAKISTKTLNVCYNVSLSKSFQWQSCSAINYLSNGINILAGDDSVPVKYGPKDTNPKRKVCVSRFTRGALCSQCAYVCLCSTRIYRHLVHDVNSRIRCALNWRLFVA